MTAQPAPDPAAQIPAAAVRVEGVTKRFGPGPAAVEGASFALAQGRFLTILGPSGSGKTTLLRMIAGFESPSAGRILIAGREVGQVAPHRRAIGMVFQRLALFPHMTAAENVAFPLKMRRHDPASIPAKVARTLDLVRLPGLGDRRIHELSGGQQQRVAIARALVFGPDLLLLDEPLAALDRQLREEMQMEFRRIQRELGVTTINVTHDQREALVVSDEVMVMEGGRIRQHADPATLYRAPADPFVARFLGVTSVLRGNYGLGGLTVGPVNLPCVAMPGLSPGERGLGILRAEQIRLGTTAEGAALDIRLRGQVVDAVFQGERQLVEVRVDVLPGASLSVLHHDPQAPAPLRPGAPVWLGWNAADLQVFPDPEAGPRRSPLPPEPTVQGGPR